MASRSQNKPKKRFRIVSASVQTTATQSVPQQQPQQQQPQPQKASQANAPSAADKQQHSGKAIIDPVPVSPPTALVTPSPAPAPAPAPQAAPVAAATIAPSAKPSSAPLESDKPVDKPDRTKVDSKHTFESTISNQPSTNNSQKVASKAQAKAQPEAKGAEEVKITSGSTKTTSISSGTDAMGSNVTKTGNTSTPSDETDRSAESVLDSNSNLKLSSNLGKQQKSTVNDMNLDTDITKESSNKAASSTIATATATTTKPTSSSAEATATAAGAMPSPSENEASSNVSHGIDEAINNIKNNNVHSSTAPISAAAAAANNNNNNVIDKDAENNILISEASPEDADDKKEAADSDNVATSASDEPQTAPSAPANQLSGDDGKWDGVKSYDRERLYALFTQSAQANEKPKDFEQISKFGLVKNKDAPAPQFTPNNKNQSQSSSSRNQYAKRPSSQGQQQMHQGGGKGSKQGVINISLSLREDVKLCESANAWKPHFLAAPNNGQTVEPESIIESLCKKVRGILNKLTPEKFQPLLEQLKALNIDSSEKLSEVISLVFEKAIDEPNFSQAYAKLCKSISEPVRDREEGSQETKRSDFKITLVLKCQDEFDNHVANENSMRQKLMPLIDEINETKDARRKQELSAQLDEEERKLRRRSVGTVRFIGELYRQDMLSTSIMDWCIAALLKINTEEKLECLCKLLTTVGQKMEVKTDSETYNAKNYRDLTPHFNNMQKIADKKSSKISSRVRFMLLDVIELRKNNWISRRNDVTNPKTMDQIVKESEAEQYKDKIANLEYKTNMSGMGNNSLKRDNRDRNDRGSRNDSRGGSMSGSGYNMGNNSNKGSGRDYKDSDGWIQTSSNKGRSSNSSTFDRSKFSNQKAVSWCIPDGERERESEEI